MPQGIIIKGIGGFYYVKLEDKVLECKARGKFRNANIIPLVGDIVDIEENGVSGVIDKIAPRKSEMVRPPVANVDQAVIVFAAALPEPNLNLLDRFLILTECNNLDAIICINKIDLLDRNVVEEMIHPYKKAGYKVIFTSKLKGWGIDELKQSLTDRITVFAGPSGVGKSSLLNTLSPNFKMKTGDISEKLERGKHTTRHSELLELDDGGYVVDTPGFSSLDIGGIKKEELQLFFPEFDDYIGDCKFTGCSHINEPGCAVKAGIEDKHITIKRYESYVNIYNEISKQKKIYKNS